MKAEIIIIKRVSCEGCSHIKKGKCDISSEAEPSAAGIPGDCPLPDITDKSKDLEAIIVKALVKEIKNGN